MRYYRNPVYDTKDRQNELHKYRKYKVSNIELDELLDRVDKYQNVNKEVIRYKIAFNAYLNNYYLWTFCCTSKNCNINKNFVENGKINECMEHTMKMIMSFDIILVDQWMNDIRTQKYVNRMLFGNISMK